MDSSTKSRPCHCCGEPATRKDYRDNNGVVSRVLSCSSCIDLTDEAIREIKLKRTDDSTPLVLKNIERSYLESKGMDCPFCKVGVMEGDEVVISEGRAFQRVYCECGAEWTDRYDLVEMQDIKEPIGE